MKKRFWGALVLVLGLWSGVAFAGESEMTTSVAFPKTEEYGTVHVEATIHAPPAVVWKFLTDVGGWRQWLSMVKESYFYSAQAAVAIPTPVSKDLALFERTHHAYPGMDVPPPAMGVSRRTTFEAYNLPWPIKDEWVVRRYTYDATLAREHRYRVSWKRAWGEFPEDGHWFITPHSTDPEAAFFVYHFRVKAKRGLALAIFSAGVKRSVENFIKAIRAATAKF